MEITKTENRKMSTGYALIQGLFWSAYCPVWSYAAYYMQESGFSGTATGITLALGSVLALFLPMVLSPIIDAGKKLTSTGAMLGTIAIQFLMGLLLLFNLKAGLLLGIACLFWTGLMYSMTPLCTEVCVAAEHAGFQVDFGTGRAFGSFTFILTSALLGKILEKNPYTILPKAGLILLFLMGASAFAVDRLLRKRRAQGGKESEGRVSEKMPEKTAGEKSISAFLKQYGDFGLLLLGLCLVFIGDGAIAQYLIKLVESLNGTAADLGYINAVYAFMEIPGMLLWRKLASKKYADVVLAASICFFVVKTFFIGLAGSVTAIYPGAVFQFLGYGIFTPAMVGYIVKKIPYEDSAKAQSLAASASTVGIILANLLCGTLIDRISARNTMVLCAGVAAVGAFISIIAIRKMAENQLSPKGEKQCRQRS